MKITKQDIGKIIYIPSTKQKSSLVGTISKVHHVNIIVKVEFRMRPNGKLHIQEHKVRKDTLPENTVIKTL